jgi:hypothetical protein
MKHALKLTNIPNKLYLLHEPCGPSSNRNLEGLTARSLLGLEGAGRRSVWEQDLHEVVGKDVSGRGGKRVQSVHLDLSTVIVETLGDDVSGG